MRAALLCLIACGGAPAPSTLTNQTPPTKKQECPTELKPLVARALGMETAEVGSAYCTPVQRRDAWYFWLVAHVRKRIEGDEGFNDPFWRILVSPNGKVAWKRREPAGSIGHEFASGTTADLDGDGQDEVLYKATLGEGGMSATKLVVINIAKEPIETSVPLIERTVADAAWCDVEWKLIGAGNARHIHVEVIESGDCFKERHVWRLAGEKTEEVK